MMTSENNNTTPASKRQRIYGNIRDSVRLSIFELKHLFTGTGENNNDDIDNIHHQSTVAERNHSMISTATKNELDDTVLSEGDENLLNDIISSSVIEEDGRDKNNDDGTTNLPPVEDGININGNNIGSDGHSDYDGRKDSAHVDPRPRLTANVSNGMKETKTKNDDDHEKFFSRPSLISRIIAAPENNVQQSVIENENHHQEGREKDSWSNWMSKGPEETCKQTVVATAATSIPSPSTATEAGSPSNTNKNNEDEKKMNIGGVNNGTRSKSGDRRSNTLRPSLLTSSIKSVTISNDCVGNVRDSFRFSIFDIKHLRWFTGKDNNDNHNHQDDNTQQAQERNSIVSTTEIDAILAECDKEGHRSSSSSQPVSRPSLISNMLTTSTHTIQKMFALPSNDEASPRNSFRWSIFSGTDSDISNSRKRQWTDTNDESAAMGSTATVSTNQPKRAKYSSNDDNTSRPERHPIRHSIKNLFWDTTASLLSMSADTKTKQTTTAGRKTPPSRKKSGGNTGNSKTNYRNSRQQVLSKIMASDKQHVVSCMGTPPSKKRNNNGNDSSKRDPRMRVRCVVCCSTCDSHRKKNKVHKTHTRCGAKTKTGCKECYEHWYELTYGKPRGTDDNGPGVIPLCNFIREGNDRSCFDIWHDRQQDELPETDCKLLLVAL